MISPFRIEVYDKNMQWKCLLANIQNIRVVPRLNNRGNVEVTIKAAHERLPLLQTDGTRLRVLFRGELIISGQVDEFWGEGPSLTGLTTFNIIDDIELFSDTLCWADPDNIITAQAKEGDTVTGPAETVFKNLVTRNLVDRSPETFTVAPDLGRGNTISVTSKFQYLDDQLFNLMTDSGLRVTALHDKATGKIIIDAAPVAAYPNTLTERSRAIKTWRFKHSRTQATDLIIGGHGEKLARQFHRFVDNARRAAIGRMIEVYVDAYDVGIDLDKHLRDIKQQQTEVAFELKEFQDATRDYNAAVTRRDHALLVKRNADNGSDATLQADANAEYNAAVSNLAIQTAAKNNAQTAYNNEVAALAALNSQTAAITTAYNNGINDVATKAFADGAAKGTLIIELAEAGNFRFGGPKGLKMGQSVACDVGGGVTITDIIREVSIDWDSENGLTIESTVGLQDSPEMQVMRAVAALARAIHNQKVSK